MSYSKPKVALLVGGTSPEREVSKSSGRSVLDALNKLGYPTIVIDPAYGTDQPDDQDQFFSKKDFTDISNRNCITAVNSKLLNGVDVVFSALHGKWAEDGTMQSLLELRGLKYTGSKVLASALSMDKALSKIIFTSNGVTTADWFVVNSKDEINSSKEKVNEKIGYPCVVKPNDQGSTVGLSIIKTESELTNSIETAFNYSEKVLIEKYIAGREITVAILDKQALPVLEIVPKSGFYDYEHKYTSGLSEYIVPAPVTEQVFSEAQRQSLLAFNSLGCEGYARIDFRLSPDDQIFCLEVNTLPGMTSTSLVPKMAKAAGISFEELIEKIISMALR